MHGSYFSTYHILWCNPGLLTGNMNLYGKCESKVFIPRNCECSKLTTYHGFED